MAGNIAGRKQGSPTIIEGSLEVRDNNVAVGGTVNLDFVDALSVTLVGDRVVVTLPVSVGPPGPPGASPGPPGPQGPTTTPILSSNRVTSTNATAASVTGTPAGGVGNPFVPRILLNYGSGPATGGGVTSWGAAKGTSGTFDNVAASNVVGGVSTGGCLLLGAVSPSWGATSWSFTTGGAVDVTQNAGAPANWDTYCAWIFGTET